MLTNRRIKKIFLNVAGLFILIVAVILRVPQLYLMAAILLLIPFVSYCVGRALMVGMSCERRLPVSCGEGEHVPVTLLVTNTGLLPKFLLRAHDRLPRWLEQSGPDAPPLLQLWPGETGQTTYLLEAAKRGVYSFGPVQMVTTDPLGFYAFAQDVPVESELVVYPVVLPLSRISADGGGNFGQRDRESGQVRGGMDFDGVREWRPGDELRRVHWRTTARTGELAVVEYAQGMASDVTIALDLNADAYAGLEEGPNSALEVAIRAAASLAAHFLREGWATHFVASDGNGTTLLMTESAHLPRLLEVLARAEMHAQGTLAGSLDAVRTAGAGGGALLYITPRVDDPALAVALNAWGGRAQGWTFDRASFAATPKKPHAKRERDASESAFAPSSGIMALGLVSVLRRGDDLQAALEGGTYARRG